jgi:nitroimidazol reductase NimA-like FMN-containing flavoprotein (pyridoxamine 5'-phosphate oxidase superfamily)
MSQAVMTDVELRGFLSQPLIADIVTLKKDGSSQVTPVWYDFDGTYLYFSTTRKGLMHQYRGAVAFPRKAIAII